MALTEEQKQRQRESYQRNKAAREEKRKQREAEKQAQLAALRRVRDDPNADHAVVVEAVRLLNELLPKY